MVRKKSRNKSVPAHVAAPRHSESPPKGKFVSSLLKLGPGLITGASDDDPSGIATYSQVGAQFGYGLLWTMPFSYPLMAVIQEISARIGRVTGRGIAGNIRRHYPKPILYGVVSLLLIANIFNLGADIGAMGAAAKLLLPGPLWIYILSFGFTSLILQVMVPYTKYVSYLKWLTVGLFAYVATAIMVGEPKWPAIRATLWPSFSAHSGYLTSLIAVLGTTISPYLFFWQASQEAEDVNVNAEEKALTEAPDQAPKEFQRIKIDTYIGMALSNVVAFFIILTSAATLHTHGILNIQTADQAAKALEPLAGRFAFLLFAVGIVGTGLLAVPVLAGSAAYGLSEAFASGRQPGKETAKGGEILRNNCGRDFHRSCPEFCASGSDQGPVLVRGYKWSRCSSCDDSHDDPDAKRKSDGQIHIAHLSPNWRMDRHGCHADCSAWHSCNASPVKTPRHTAYFTSAR